MKSQYFYILVSGLLLLAACADHNNLQESSQIIPEFQTPQDQSTEKIEFDENGPWIEEWASATHTQKVDKTTNPVKQASELDFNDPMVLKVLDILSGRKRGPTKLSPETSSSSISNEPDIQQAENPDAVPAPEEKLGESVSEKGIVTPTVYYFPVINEDEVRCRSKVEMRDIKSKRLISVCSETKAKCAMQGSCAVVQGGKLRSFNISSRHNAYFEMTQDDCKFGYGVNSACLDPFYSLAADLRIYKPGDVIFIPKIRGLKLPDNSIHSGYFVVRDKGRAIVGRGRFDFFSGYFSWQSAGNPFTEIGLNSKGNKFPYYRIRGKLAKTVQDLRAFPNLPKKVIDKRPRE